jgi:hypothetical protein
VPVEQRDRVQSIWICNPSGATSRHAGQPPANVVAAAHFRLLRNQEAKKRPADISKSDEGEIIERNMSLVILIMN